MKNKIVLNYVESYDFDELNNAVSFSLEQFDLKSKLKPKSKIMLKVCLPNQFSPDCAEITHPAVVRAFASKLSSMGYYCLIVDSPYTKNNVQALENIYLNTDYLEVENQANCNLNDNIKVFTLNTPDGISAKSLTLLDALNDVDAIINIGKIKLDESFGYFGAVSNLFGLVPAEMKNLLINRLYTLRDFNNFVIDIYQAIKDKLFLNVLDGIVAMEANRTPRMLSCLAVGADIFDLDACIMDIIGIKYANTMLTQAKEREYFKYYQERDIVGSPITKFKVKDFLLFDFNNDTVLNYSKEHHNIKHVQKRVEINKNNCKGCSRCEQSCPAKAIIMKTDNKGELYAHIDYKKCIFCLKCFDACPYHVANMVEPNRYKKVMKDIFRNND